MIQDIVKKVRKRRGLTQRELAEKAGLKAIQVSQFERGVIKGGKTFRCICEALEIPEQVIVFRTLKIEDIKCDTKRELFNEIAPKINNWIDGVFGL